MAILVSALINAVKNTLQETGTGIRWTNTELVDYLNQSYDWLLGLMPEAFADNSECSCAAGTRQELPVGAVRLVDIKRNLEGAMRPVNFKSQEQMDRVIPDWHSRPASNQQQYFIYDERDPLRFYVYPPAKAGSLLELVVALTPRSRHTLRSYDENTEKVFVREQYNEALRHYIIFLAFDKDSEDSFNAQLAQANLQRAYNAIGVKMQNDVRVSPKNPVNKQ